MSKLMAALVFGGVGYFLAPRFTSVASPKVLGLAGAATGYFLVGR
jgi:hypothetical protein